MLKKFLKGISISMLVLALSSSSAFAVSGTVTGSTVRIREKADSNSQEVSVAVKNEKVEVIGEEGNWYKVKFENVTGYMSKDYIDTDYSSESNSGSSQTEQPTTQEPEETTPPTTPEPEENTNTTEPEEQETTQTPPEEQQNAPDTSSEEQSTSNEQLGTIYQENQTVTINEASNLKFLPSFTSRNSGKVEAGATCTIRYVLNNWVKIENNTDSGWILTKYIKGEDSPEQTPPEEQPTPDTTEPEDNESNTSTEATRKGVVNVESAVLRRDADGEAFDSVKEGTEVIILGEEGDWYNISVGEYDNCYIAKRLITEK